MQLSFTNFEDALGYFYDCPNQFTDAEFWKTISTTLQVPQECMITSLYTSQSFILKIFKFLTSLPYKKTACKIIRIATQFLDASPSFFKNIIQELVPCLENQIPCLSTLNVCLSFYNEIFSHQSPTNENFDSCIYLYGEEEGITVNDLVKWPFEKGGTLVFWYNMSQKTKECKIFECLNQEKIGFEIVMRNKKIYVQKQQDQTKFRLIKNNSSFLCDAVFNKNVKLCIEFEIKKKFFQPYLSINLIMNNFAINGVQIDSFSTSSSLFKIKLFKSFYGKFYSTLIMNEKVASQVDQINNQKGFILQSDIRNFSYLFDVSNDRVFLLFSPTRSKTQCENPPQPQQSNNEIEDQLKQITFNSIKPIKTFLYDAIGSQKAEIGPKACCYQNHSIGKQIENYGGFQSVLPFINMLQICACNDELYMSALNLFLEFIKSMFQSKADSIEKACHLHFFELLTSLFEKTKMQGFSYETITRLKQLYISLNTRTLRQKFLQEVVWGVNFGLYLNEQNFTNYIKFIKTFYNEDIHNNLQKFNVTKIIRYLIENIDNQDCCFEHSFQKQVTKIKIKNYQKTLCIFFEVLENIILMKRSEPDLEEIIKDILYGFGLSVSSCFIQMLIQFLQKLFEKDELIQKKVMEFIQAQNNNCKFYLYKCLSSCTSWRAKGKIIEFILRVLELNLFNDEKKQREMLTLCARYPTMNYLRTSSLKAKSHQNRDSVDYSEDKLSLNSAAMYKFIIINPIETKGETLLDDFKTIQIIFNWAFSQKVLNITAEDHQNPGLLILMQLYKGATYRLRQKMSSMIRQKMKLIRFGPQLMAWAIQCSLIAQFDLSQTQSDKTQIQHTKQNLIQLIINYNFSDPQQQQQNNEISIIKLVLSSVRSKYPDDIIKAVENKLFFVICNKKMQKFIYDLNTCDHSTAQNIQNYDHLCNRVISNVITFMNQYFVIKGDGDQNQFDEEMAQILEVQNLIVIDIMDKILQVFVIVATLNDRKIIQEANAERNHFALTLLFPEKQKQKQKINLMFLIFGALQNLFEFFEDLEIEPKKKAAVLIKKYMIYIIQLTENSGNAKIQHLQEDLGNMFLLIISFIERKYHQYFYYPYQRHKNIDFQLENKIRKSIQEIKKTLYNSFLDITELIQYIDEKGDLEHKSFYQLMKPKRKHAHKYPLKHIYPAIWKKNDEKIKQFLCLKRQTLRKDAQQKLESHLILKKVSLATDNIEKNIAKKIFLFVESQRKLSDVRQKKSVNFYKSSQSEKCRNFCQCEELLLQNRIRISEQEKSYLSKQRQIKNLKSRQLKHIKQKIWNVNRTFSGFWANKDFYLFAQNQIMKFDNSLSKKYQRIRSKRQSKYFLMPFIEIVALQPNHQHEEEQQFFANQLFTQGMLNLKNQNQNQKRVSGSTASDKLINGLQFIKKKVYSKLVKAISMAEQPTNNKQDNKIFLIDNVLWVLPMKVYSGFLKLEAGKLSYCHKANKNIEHISLFKNQLSQSEKLIKQWKISQIQGFQIKRYLLKQNSVQLYLKQRKSLFFCFHGSTPQQYNEIILQITQICNISSISPDNSMLTCGDPIKMWQHLQITQKWLNYQISNFDYLMCLNFASGRTNCDLNQYPVMPWVFSRYTETKFKKHQDKYRDFSKNMALLGKEQRVKKFQQLYQSLTTNYSDQFPVPHYFGFHYSNLGIILQYLIRVNPYSQGAKILQGGKFDIPDRLFYSISQSFKCSTTQMSDLRELIPQFFYFPQFLINAQQYDFGSLQGQNKKVNHVQLPDGCLNAFDFIQLHREALQSKQVSQNLHKWIDLIFGFRNSGREAEKAMNVYHYLTNQVNSDKIDSIDDVQQKEGLQSQMAYYGKTPSQIFTRAHPQRSPKPSFDFQQWEKVAFSLSQNFSKIYKQENPNIIDSTLHFSYNEKTKSYCLIGRNGKGLIFTIDKKQIIKINQFSINIQKIQGINMLDISQPQSQTINIENIENQCLIIGNLWSGRLSTINIMNSNTDINIKHTETVSKLKYSNLYKILFSGSVNGQLCKWEYRERRIYFVMKVCCYAKINCLEICQDLKVIGVGTDFGELWIFGIQNMEVIRIIKVEEQIENCCFLKFPFYSLFLLCKNSKQYCYSLNGTKLQQAQLQIQDTKICIFKEDIIHQKILLRIKQQLIFLKIPDFDIEDKLQVGIGNVGFLFNCNFGQIVVVNQMQVLLWRRNRDQVDKN